MNWFLFRVTESFTDEDGTVFEAGSNGVGMCSMAPGIMEAPHGIMYVVPKEWVERFHADRKQSKYCATLVEDAVRAYFGVRI